MAYNGDPKTHSVIGHGAKVRKSINNVFSTSGNNKVALTTAEMIAIKNMLKREVKPTNSQLITALYKKGLYDKINDFSTQFGIHLYNESFKTSYRSKITPTSVVMIGEGPWNYYYIIPKYKIIFKVNKDAVKTTTEDVDDYISSLKHYIRREDITDRNTLGLSVAMAVSQFAPIDKLKKQLGNRISPNLPADEVRKQYFIYLTTEPITDKDMEFVYDSIKDIILKWTK